MKKLQSLKAMMEQKKQLEKDVHHLAHEAMPGQYVQWDHGGHTQEGVVIDVWGWGGNTTVRVKNLNTEKIRRLRLEAIAYCGGVRLQGYSAE